MVEPWKWKPQTKIISESGLFLDKTNCFIRASPDCLMASDCCEDAGVEIKCPLLINYEKPNEKNLDYLYKSDSEIKLKTNHSYFTQCIYTSNGSNQQKIGLLCCMDSPW